ncbi:NAD(P)-dependent dehydrogenase (short-subunit alcohol dehydrogenase family) [Pseudoclavibacter sp. JAI123]|uniref:SDR family oxidoreductase n=1 Tax=Pseudoclavibacter sp. JAI123 TaxID=2723065 RepID=UPI0015CABD2D|nr:SDR family oxidoreductase [Pseudoclavibacter sp. JAI123]NYF13694.1 NAD(P)-dependent dehydrogenase (short-subunit alcohol dehydrogenase family) [Pseudoclavibacter sp. JAI123]
MSTIFITGTSTGLGRAAVELFSARGWRVIATMRAPEKETELGDLPGVTLKRLDVTDPDAIVRVVAETLAEEPVDVLFNNAGYGLAGPFEAATDEQIVQNITTNLLGVMRVTKEFIPHFRERGAGVILTTTSIGGKVTMPFNSVYHAAKFGAEGWSEGLAYELAPFGIRVKTLAPGGIRTDFGGRSLDQTAHPDYLEALIRATSRFRDPSRDSTRSSAEQVAQAAFDAVTDGSEQITYVVGQDAQEYMGMREQLGQSGFVSASTRLFFG